MNTRQVIASLSKVANELDNSGMFEEANEITNVMKRISQAQPWSFKPTPQAPTKPGMNANEVVYKVLKNNFGPDYNNMKDIKLKIRDNYSSLVNEIQALSQESGVDSQKAALRLKQVMDASSWHSEANKPAMYGQGGGTSVFDPTQKVNNSSIDKTPGQMGLETKAFDWIAANGGEGAEKAIQKAVAQTQAKKMSPVMLNQIKALLQPRVDKEYNRLKALQGTAAGAMGSFNREPKPFAIGD
jgi:hypothetical protein